MKEKRIKHIAERHCKKLAKYAGQSKDFDEEIVHQLRVEYKKLRSLVKMIAPAGKWIISKKLKKIYQLAGIIRDLQLQLNHINLEKKKAPNELSLYYSWLQQQQDKLKPELLKKISGLQLAAGKAIKTGWVPSKFSASQYQEYAAKKWKRLFTINATVNFSDATIHTIRKQLKELFYNQKCFNQAEKKLAPKKSGAKQPGLNNLLQLLGNYQDKCTTVKLINLFYADNPGAKENETFIQIKKQWLKEKAAMKRPLIKQLQAFIAEAGSL